MEGAVAHPEKQVGDAAVLTLELEVEQREGAGEVSCADEVLELGIRVREGCSDMGGTSRTPPGFLLGCFLLAAAFIRASDRSSRAI